MKKVLLCLVVLTAILLAWFAAVKLFNLRHTTTAPVLALGNDEKITAVIVPHFDFFADKRSELLGNIAKKTQPKTIILVSVNHFNTGENDILTTDQEWSTGGGAIAADKELVDKLAMSKVAQIDQNAFAPEHGIKNILDNIKQYFPQSKILPIIIKDTTGKSEIDKLATWVTDNAQDSLLISSVDFSHYCPPAIARVHDSFSIQALDALDTDKIWQAETDSPQTLYLTAAIAKAQKDNFHLFYNNNSSDVSASDVETTSVVLGYFSNNQSESKPEPATSFVIAGDAMFDRDVWNGFNAKGLTTIFDNFGTRPFRGSDLSLLNLEGPISKTPISGTRAISLMSFNFSPLVPSVLKYININAVSLANNHTNNAGQSGFDNTKKVLTESGIKSFGLSAGVSDDSIIQVDGPIPLSIIGVDALSSFDEKAMETMISAEKKAGRFVLIFPHWGTEYAASHSSGQENLAKSWTTAGADMIVGSHPHVTEDFAMVNNKPVIYSLGNFVFDQFFSPETQRGLVLAGLVEKNKIVLSFLPTQEKTVRPEFLFGTQKADILNKILDNKSQLIKQIGNDTIEITR